MTKPPPTTLLTLVLCACVSSHNSKLVHSVCSQLDLTLSAITSLELLPSLFSTPAQLLYYSFCSNDLHHVFLLFGCRSGAFQIVQRNYEQGHIPVGGWQSLSSSLSVSSSLCFFFSLQRWMNVKTIT